MQWNCTAPEFQRPWWQTMVSLIFMAETGKACTEFLSESNILCYLVITQADIYLSESGKAETSYLNLDW